MFIDVDLNDWKLVLIGFDHLKQQNLSRYKQIVDSHNANDKVIFVGKQNNVIDYYFKSKIDDLNIIIGQQQLEALDQIITIYKNKNKNDKIENIKKNNIQKSVLWCEKYKIPCNKFSEKINIFLPIINESI
jgi:hypothetical protein